MTETTSNYMRLKKGAEMIRKSCGSFFWLYCYDENSRVNKDLSTEKFKRWLFLLEHYNSILAEYVKERLDLGMTNNQEHPLGGYLKPEKEIKEVFGNLETIELDGTGICLTVNAFDFDIMVCDSELIQNIIASGHHCITCYELKSIHEGIKSGEIKNVQTALSTMQHVTSILYKV